MLLNLVFPRVKQRNEALHTETLDHFRQLLVNMRLYRLRILVENRCVHQFVLLSCFELHAVRVAKSLHHVVKIWVEDDLLKAPNHLIEIVIILVSCPMVSHFKVLLIIIFAFDLKVSA